MAVIKYITPTTGTTWTVPTGVTSVTVEAVGGGGGGSSGTADGGGYRSGAAGGGYTKGSFSVNAGEVYTIVVGAGGVGRTGSGYWGTKGGDSKFYSGTTKVLTAKGGDQLSSFAGSVVGGTSINIYTGGQGGMADSVMPDVNSLGCGGGGGGGAGSSGNGTDGTGGQGGTGKAGGAGASISGGTGGQGGNAYDTGSPFSGRSGQLYGGGGGGGGISNGNNALTHSGNGAGGYVILTYSADTTTTTTTTAEPTTTTTTTAEPPCITRLIYTGGTNTSFNPWALGITGFTVTIWSGGGGGSSAKIGGGYGVEGGGDGGDGGNYIKAYIINSGTTGSFSINVGLGGTGGTYQGTGTTQSIGGNGGNTLLLYTGGDSKPIVIAYGGAGGMNSNTSGSAVSSDGTGGSIDLIASYNGGTGANGAALGYQRGGGGGGGAGTTANGSNAGTPNLAGSGGSLSGGTGGVGGWFTGAGAAGSIYGGGGGGGELQYGTDSYGGGAGGDGLMIIEYICTTGTTTTTTCEVPVGTNQSFNGCSTVAFNYNPQDYTSIPSTFTWTATYGSLTGGAGSGTGNINETLTNGTYLPVNAVYTITPTATGCVAVGSTFTITITIYPKPVGTGTTISDISSNETFTITCQDYVTLTGCTFTWTAAYGSNITGGAGSGTGNITETLINSGVGISNVVYTIIPTANGCVGNSFQITVPIIPLVSVSLSGYVIGENTILNWNITNEEFYTCSADTRVNIYRSYDGDNFTIIQSGYTGGTTYIDQPLVECVKCFRVYYKVVTICENATSNVISLVLGTERVKWNLGGVQKLWIASKPSTLTYYVMDATYKTIEYDGNNINTISGFTQTLTWYELPVSETVNYTQKMSITAQGYVFAEVLQVEIPKLNPAKWQGISDLLGDDLIVVFLTNNDQYCVMGYDSPAQIDVYEATTEDSKYNFSIEVKHNYSLMKFIDVNYVINNIL